MPARGQVVHPWQIIPPDVGAGGLVCICSGPAVSLAEREARRRAIAAG
jgi:hypothetical protein